MTEARSAASTSTAAAYVPAFDGVRGLVSLSIALVHVQLAMGWAPGSEFLHSLRASWFFSIEFLFLLGGFVAFLPVALQGRFSGARTYGLRRAGRILPLYYLTLALAIVLGPWLRPVVGAGAEDVPHDFVAVLAHVAFLQQMVYPFASGLGVQGIIWTMSTVAVFYVAFPFIARSFLRRPLVWLAGAVAVSVAWRIGLTDVKTAYLQPPLFAVDFGIGMVAASGYARVRRGEWSPPRPSRALVLCGASLVGLFALLYVSGLPVVQDNDRSHLWRESVALSLIVPSVFALFLVSLPFVPGWAQWPLSNRVARFVGQNGYGLFLAHFLVIWAVLALVDIPRDGTSASTLKLTAIAIPLTLLFGWLGTKLVESPVRRRAQELAARPPRRKKALAETPGELQPAEA